MISWMWERQGASRRACLLRRVGIKKVERESVRDLPLCLLRPTSMEALDLEKDGHVGSLWTASATHLAKRALQRPVRLLQQRDGADTLAWDSIECRGGDRLLTITLERRKDAGGSCSPWAATRPVTFSALSAWEIARVCSMSSLRVSLCSSPFSSSRHVPALLRSVWNRQRCWITVVLSTRAMASPHSPPAVLSQAARPVPTNDAHTAPMLPCFPHPCPAHPGSPVCHCHLSRSRARPAAPPFFSVVSCVCVGTCPA